MPVGMSGGALPTCPTTGGAPGGWGRGRANDEQRFGAKTHNIASGLAGSPLQGPGVHSGGLHTGRSVKADIAPVTRCVWCCGRRKGGGVEGAGREGEGRETSVGGEKWDVVVVVLVDVASSEFLRDWMRSVCGAVRSHRLNWLQVPGCR